MASTTSLTVASLFLATSRSRSNGQEHPVKDRVPSIGTLSIVRGATSDSGHATAQRLLERAGERRHQPGASRAAPQAIATARPGSPNRSRPPRRESGVGSGPGSTGSHSAGPPRWPECALNAARSIPIAETPSATHGEP